MIPTLMMILNMPRCHTYTICDAQHKALLAE